MTAAASPPPSRIRDPGRAASGWQKIRWVEPHMPVVAALERRLAERGSLRGRRIAICLHLEAKTARMALALHRAGAQVAICGSNPLSTQDDVAAALAEAGVAVYAWHGATPAEYAAFLDDAVAFGPHLVLDDGGDLVAHLHTRHRDRLGSVRGGTEETTTGVLRLQAMARDGVLAFPMVATNDARMKQRFDNRYGTGQSVWDGIMRLTNLVVAGKTVVVCGYGWCGKGVAERARGLGARVIVCEVDPIRANEALMDGHQVMPSTEAAALGDVFVTVTGCRDVLVAEHFRRMKDGALLANAGHFDVEIRKPDLEALARRVEEGRPGVRTYVLDDGRRLHLLADGRLVNLAGGDGHPAEIMDLSFGLQLLALEWVDREADRLGPGVHPLPEALDREVASLHLEARGIRIDRLRPEQVAYLASWREGTA
ncbi:adenosylhomocysteinase [Thermaerobacter composti]|uniref:Adenosylhomocysteinase n=1 Tax=Thermaerobacter composti TaxID=554949 RepID=A0ABZ0QU92_9FIRM|nr:adenosylhomocysteinase [Thermaerobacter composti]PZN09160.1 MAG: adenosylhomocysteinase [Bacillota bacterium]WPD20075.1 adenosylhomocysteinase [Thermaerobacter composti]